MSLLCIFVYIYTFLYTLYCFNKSVLRFSDDGKALYFLFSLLLLNNFRSVLFRLSSPLCTVMINLDRKMTGISASPRNLQILHRRMKYCITVSLHSQNTNVYYYYYYITTTTTTTGEYCHLHLQILMKVLCIPLCTFT